MTDTFNFEDGDYYWVKISKDTEWEIAEYSKQCRGFFVIGELTLFTSRNLHAIMFSKIKRPKK